MLHRTRRRLFVRMCLAFMLCLSFVLPLHAGEPPLSQLEELAFKEAAALASASIVRIETVGGLDRVSGLLTTSGPTTGVIVSEDGSIVSSAFNFISKPSSILVQLPDGRRFAARIVATDRLKMLTLLSIDAQNLAVLDAAPKAGIRVGQWAIALGRTYDSPLPSISVGIVSALNRIWGRAIQTDAKVSPVNYGGPLVDIRGRALGVLVPLSPEGTDDAAGVEWYDSGIGFAIPMEDVLAVLDRLKEGEDLHPGLMGIQFSGDARLGESVEIARVRTESPADKAGLKPDDVLVAIDGANVSRLAEVKHALGNRYAGDTVRITVRRGDETIDSELTLVKELLPYESGFLGILPMREPADGEERPGVGVRHVFADSPAAEAQLRPLDRIIGMNGIDVAEAASLTRLVEGVRPGEKSTLVSLRDGREATVETTLSSIPHEVPAELSPSVIPPGDKASVEDGDANEASDNAGDAQEGPPRTGRFTVDMAALGHSYWAYVPEDYNPAFQYGLMVWVHPNHDTMEATVFNRWRAICERRGIILLGPKALEPEGWNPNEAEFVRDAAAEMMARYTIDPSRVFLHSYSDGGRFAYHLAFKYRELFRGLAVVAQPLSMRPPENEPEARLQIYLLCGEDDPLHRGVEASAQILRGMKFPVGFRTWEGAAHEYPPPEGLEEIARWADCLDRI